MEKAITGYLDRHNARKVADVLRAGGIAVLPTDTIYGFHCSSSRVEAIKGIVGIKGRRSGTGFILLASDIGLVDGLVSPWPPDARAFLSGCWPAPLTAILPSSKKVHPLLASKGRVAVRIPDFEELRILIEMVGEALVSTSVNVTGRDPMTRIREIQNAFPGLPAYMSRRGRAGTLPSTVVDFSISPPALIRAGRYAWPPRE